MDKINLPQIMSSSEHYGTIVSKIAPKLLLKCLFLLQASGPLKGVPICGVSTHDTVTSSCFSSCPVFR